jgi:fructose-specific phosphotransferase system IIC component
MPPAGFNCCSLENDMTVPARFAPLLFGALLSAIMVAIVSGFVLATTQGLHAGLLAQWLKSCATTWPVAFPTVTLVAPWVRRVVAGMTA